jgi:hypothetical protein
MATPMDEEEEKLTAKPVQQEIQMGNAAENDTAASGGGVVRGEGKGREAAAAAGGDEAEGAADGGVGQDLGGTLVVREVFMNWAKGARVVQLEPDHIRQVCDTMCPAGDTNIE